jgi:hypothetical protein
MPYYKFKIRSFDTKEEQWIAFYEIGIHEAVLKANQMCINANSNCYALEQHLCEITGGEYDKYLMEGF